MAKRDYYEILGIARDAEQAEIKKSFRRLAMKHHPDRNPDNKEAAEKFKEAREAYEILSNAEKRQAYDQFGHAGVEQNAGGGFGGGFSGGFNASDIFSGFEDVFGEAFGGGGRQQARGQAGANLRYDLTLSLEEAVAGKTITIDVYTWVRCGSCKGSGAKAGSKPKNCQQCGAQGRVRVQQGPFVMEQVCPACHGAGKIIVDLCQDCNGQGRKKQDKKLSVKIPAGVDDGDRIRLAGEGEAGGQGAPTGDLFVHIRVKPHDVFSRDGVDLHCEVPINFVMATVGGVIEIPTLSGKVKLKIPQETQSGKLFRLRGKGVQSVRGRGAGDMLCRVMLETPVKLSKQQKKLLEEFDKSLQQDGIDHSPKSAGFFQRVKVFFEGIAG